MMSPGGLPDKLAVKTVLDDTDQVLCLKADAARDIQRSPNKPNRTRRVMPEADAEGARFYADQPQTAPGSFLKGSHQLDWGMKNRLARVVSPTSGRTVMLAV